MAKQVTVFTKNECGICENVKRWLKWANVPYTEINVEDNAEALNYVKEGLGYQAMPVIEVTDTDGIKYNFQGFNSEELAKLKV